MNNTAQRFPMMDAYDIESTFGKTMYERGYDYALIKDMIRTLKWNEDKSRLEGTVAGSQNNSYRARVHVYEIHDMPGLWAPDYSECTCPVGSNCKHGAALAIMAATRAEEANPDLDPDDAPVGVDTVLDNFSDFGLTRASDLPTSEPDPSALGPSWRSVLGEMLPENFGATNYSDVALGVELFAEMRTTRHSWAARYTSTWAEATYQDLVDDHAALSVRLRPMRRGKRGNWIKGGINWPNFDHPVPTTSFPIRPEQATAMHRLNQLYSSSVSGLAAKDLINLSVINMTYMWELLAEAHEAGIPLIGQGIVESVGITDPARIIFDTTAADDGSIEFQALAQLNQESVKPYATVGSTGLLQVHTNDDDLNVDIRLIPVDEPLQTTILDLLESREPLQIPADDVDDFMTDFYPRLTGVAPVVSKDETVELPEIPPAKLRMVVEFGHELFAGTKVDALKIITTWHYTGAEDQSEHQQRVLQVARDIWPDISVPQRITLTAADAARFTEHVLPELGALEHVEIQEAEEIPDYQELTGEPSIVTNAVASHQHDWFNLGFHVVIDDKTIPFTDIFIALVRGHDSVLLPDKTYFSLEHPAFDKLRELVQEAAQLEEWKPEHTAVSRFSAQMLERAEEFSDEVNIDPTIQEWMETLSKLQSTTKVPEAHVPATVKADLRDYQVEGFRWLAYLYDLRLGGVLADDMGLGKTLQTLALIDYAITNAKKDGDRKNFLVIAPSSVLTVWRDEVARFVPHLRVAVLDSSSLRRRESLEEIRGWADIVVTSYAIARIDDTEFAEHTWAGVILDEAQFVKNRATKAHQAIATIPAEFSLAITGTPMENSLSDVWSIFNLTVPGLFPKYSSFRDDYLKPIEAGQRADANSPDDPAAESAEEKQAKVMRRADERMRRLRTRIRPFMLRRTKEKVASELPEKQEQVLRVPMEAEHQTLYDRVLQRERKKVLNLITDMDANRMSVFRSLTLLRMLALDPAIVDEDYAKVPGSKLNDLMSRLDEVLADKHRVIIFSQFTSFLGLVAEALEENGIEYAYLDGSTRNRAAVIDRFRNDEIPVFLISLKAGGFGLTLTEADYVFLMDPWWNPAVEAQAVDRAHRIGQDKNVMVYRMVSAGTIEEKVLELQQQKAELFNALTEEGSAFASSITADDIKALFDEPEPGKD